MIVEPVEAREQQRHGDDEHHLAGFDPEVEHKQCERHFVPEHPDLGQGADEPQPVWTRPKVNATRQKV
jgi:hypothetical protein